MSSARNNYQSLFAQRWGHLANAHVRALAWLIDAPGLLDPHAPEWQGRVATTPPAPEAWLTALDIDPSVLDAFLGARNYTRIGLYAEKLMAFYLGQQQELLAHGLQVRAARNDTIGEFDFLLAHGSDGAEHWEFATKFYLLNQARPDAPLDAMVGPNLADSLGAKMRKIFSRQLELGKHPAAQAVLPRPVHLARALVKGWLFYPGPDSATLQGIAPGHCRGFWCALNETDALLGEHYVILPRLQWLAPFRGTAEALALSALQTVLAERFAQAPTPALIACVREEQGQWVETERAFIVPDDWRARALSAFSRQ